MCENVNGIILWDSVGVLKLSNISYGSISVQLHAVSPVQNLLYIKIIHFFYTLLIFISNYNVHCCTPKSYMGVREKYLQTFRG